MIKLGDIINLNNTHLSTFRMQNISFITATDFVVLGYWSDLK